MFRWVERRRYQKDVVDTIFARLIEYHGKERGKECAGAFATAILQGQKYHDLPHDLINKFQAMGLSVQDGAVSYLDAAVNVCKGVMTNDSGSADVKRLVSDMESCIDRMYLAEPSVNIVPRNGSVGQLMEPWTKDALI